MSKDVAECLEGLRKVYSSSPTVSRQFSEDGVELTLGDDGSGSAEEDVAISRRVSIVEESLYQVLKLEENSALEFDEAKLQSVANTMTKAMKLPLSHMPHAFPCKDTYKALPAPPSAWPQRPLMVRPTPSTSTKVIGIRRATGTTFEHFSGFCAGCILPINNGREREGEAVVVDFESTHFVGTMMIRLKQAPDNGTVNYKDERNDYFEGKKRKFHAVVKGKFKRALSMNQCVTGQTFDRPSGRLPARWIVTAFIKFISTLAPQLEATLDGNRPRFLTPLVATAHTVVVKSSKDSLSQDMEDDIEEPSSVEATSALASVPDSLGVNVPDTTKSSIVSRMKARKRVFNALAAKKSSEPRFDIDKEYTFEFYQHLLDFGEELAIDMGRVGGKVGLAQATDGQPLKIMAAYRDHETQELDTLWSFDIWHESLYPFAEMAMESKTN